MRAAPRQAGLERQHERDALHAACTRLERDRIQIITTLPEEKLPPVWAVPGQLDDIWLNLLLNAHDALIGREGAQIGISAAYIPEAKDIEVIAWDNGPGIPAKIIDEIFFEFIPTNDLK